MDVDLVSSNVKLKLLHVAIYIISSYVDRWFCHSQVETENYYYYSVVSLSYHCVFYFYNKIQIKSAMFVLI